MWPVETGQIPQEINQGHISSLLEMQYIYKKMHMGGGMFTRTLTSASSGEGLGICMCSLHVCAH